MMDKINQLHSKYNHNLVLKNIIGSGLIIPTPSVPVANYIPCSKSGSTIFVSGQLAFDPSSEGKLICGKMGEKEFTIEDGYKAAQACALNVIAQVINFVLENSPGASLSSSAQELTLNKLEQLKCLKLSVLVNSTQDFIDHPKVANGASDTMVKIFGENGKHTRAAFGVSSLPLGSMVEVEAVFESN